VIKLEQSDCAICGGKDSHHICYQCFSSEMERVDALEDEVKALKQTIETLKKNHDWYESLFQGILARIKSLKKGGK